MQAQGKGAIVNISSVHSFQTVNGVAPYCASKGGITALTRNMAIDYGPDHPGQFHRSRLGADSAHPEHLRQLRRPRRTAAPDGTTTR